MLESTDGPFEHVRVVCVGCHWFLMPLEALARRSPDPQPAGRVIESTSSASSSCSSVRAPFSR